MAVSTSSASFVGSDLWVRVAVASGSLRVGGWPEPLELDGRLLPPRRIARFALAVAALGALMLAACR